MSHSGKRKLSPESADAGSRGRPAPQGRGADDKPSEFDLLRSNFQAFCDSLANEDERKELIQNEHIMNYRLTKRQNPLREKLRSMQKSTDFLLLESDQDIETKAEVKLLRSRAKNAFSLLVMDSYAYFITISRAENKTGTVRTRRLHMWDTYSEYVDDLWNDLQDALRCGDEERARICNEFRKDLMTKQDAHVAMGGEIKSLS
jgi:hypothetical protein